MRTTKFLFWAVAMMLVIMSPFARAEEGLQGPIFAVPQELNTHVSLEGDEGGLRISLELAEDSPDTTIQIKDKNGMLVTTLSQGRLFEQGKHEVYWNGKNSAGLEMPVKDFYVAHVESAVLSHNESFFMEAREAPALMMKGK